VDNRNLARIAKLAGAPRSPAAGIQYLAPIGRIVRQGDLLFTIHASSQGELDYAMDFLGTLPNLIRIES
jgi:thymidine phosphorylase